MSPRYIRLLTFFRVMGSAVNLVMYYGPLWRILLCTTYVLLRRIWYALRATVANLFMRYAPLYGMKRIENICDNFHARGHSAGFGYALWAIEQDLVTHYVPWRRIWLCLWVIAQDLVTHYVP
jgi:hypothetical protein